MLNWAAPTLEHSNTGDLRRLLERRERQGASEAVDLQARRASEGSTACTRLRPSGSYWHVNFHGDDLNPTDR